MIIRLKTESLRQFQKRAVQLTTNTLLPILTNLKLSYSGDICTLTKNNIGAVIVGQVEATGDACNILISERIFFAIVSSSKQEFIEIQVEADRILIIDSDKTYLPIEDVAQFVNPPEYSSEADAFKFDKDHLKAIRIASNFTNDLPSAGFMQFVHTSGENIFAFHTNYFYINGSFKGLPVASLRSEEIKILSEIDEIEFMDLPNHHVFFTPGYEYIFTKTEAAMPKLDAVFASLNLPGKNFTCNTSDLVDFIQRANLISESEIAQCSITPAGMFLQLRIDDANYSRSNERLISSTGEPDEWVFNSRVLLNPMRAIPYEILNAKTNRNYLIIQAGNEWYSFAGMSKS